MTLRDIFKNLDISEKEYNKVSQEIIKLGEESKEKWNDIFKKIKSKNKNIILSHFCMKNLMMMKDSAMLKYAKDNPDKVIGQSVVDPEDISIKNGMYGLAFYLEQLLYRSSTDYKMQYVSIILAISILAISVIPEELVSLLFKTIFFDLLDADIKDILQAYNYVFYFFKEDAMMADKILDSNGMLH